MVRLSGTTYIKAQADTEANAEAVGIVVSVEGPDDFTIQTSGHITGLSGLTAGSVYYLDDDTAGLLTLTEPPDVGDVSKPLLIADTTTSGWIFNMRGFINTATSVLPGIDGWTDDTATTWTYASAVTFTIAGDVTAKFSKGTRLKLTQTTVKYFVVVGSSFGGGNTTVTITGGDDYTFTNAAVSNNYYSYAVNPQGYPGWFSYATSVTQGGFSSPPARELCRFSVVDSKCTFAFGNYNTSGTSNTTSFTVSLPVAAGIIGGPPNYWLRYGTGAAGAATPGMAEISASTTLTLYKDGAAATWTASGSKWARFQIVYEI